MKKKKNILESIHHFDRFNSDLYRDIVNRKNNIEPDIEDYIYQEDNEMGCIYLLILLFFISLLFIGLTAVIYYVL